MAKRRSRNRRRSQQNAAANLNQAPIAADPLNGVHTNNEIFKTALLVFWIAALFLMDIQITSDRYLNDMHPDMRPQPPSISYHPSTESAFRVSRTVTGISFVVLLRIFSEINQSQDQGPRRINLYHEAFLRTIFLANWIVWIARCEVAQSVNEEFMLLFISSLLLVQAWKEGLLGMFLDWVKRMSKE